MNRPGEGSFSEENNEEESSNSRQNRASRHQVGQDRQQTADDRRELDNAVRDAEASAEARGAEARTRIQSRNNPRPGFSGRRSRLGLLEGPSRLLTVSTMINQCERCPQHWSADTVATTGRRPYRDSKECAHEAELPGCRRLSRPRPGLQASGGSTLPLHFNGDRNSRPPSRVTSSRAHLDGTYVESPPCPPAV